MGSSLIDEAGNMWRTTDPQLRKHLMSSFGSAELSRYVVENMGWARISAGERSLRVACRPRLLTDQTLAALFLAVYDANPRTIRLDVLASDWQHYVLGERAMFIRLLSAMVVGNRRPTAHWHGRLLSRPTTDSPLAASTHVAATCLGLADRLSDVYMTLDLVFQGRWHICSVDTATGHSVARVIGTTFTPFNPGWHASGLNQSLCSYADDAYGLWVAAHQRGVSISRAPVFDDVDAIVSFPRIGETRLRYRRVTLPIGSRDGQDLVLSASAGDTSVDLRQLAG